MKKTHLYVDGFNLYYSAVRKTPLRWLNPPPDYIKIYKTEEKGSDVNLASQFPKELSDQMGTFRCPLDWQ